MTKSAAYGARLAFGDVNKTANPITAATNLLTVTAHGYTATQPVMLKSGLAGSAPLIAKKVYYVKTVLTNTFDLGWCHHRYHVGRVGHRHGAHGHRPDQLALRAEPPGIHHRRHDP